MNKDFTTMKIPGLKKYGNVVMKRGVCLGDNEFFDWWKTVGNQVASRDIQVSLLNEAHEPTVVWSLRNTWPVSLRTSGLHAYKSKVVIERLELAHEGITIKNH
jgi:phage tail-like protein